MRQRNDGLNTPPANRPPGRGVRSFHERRGTPCQAHLARENRGRGPDPATETAPGAVFPRVRGRR